MCKAIRSLSGAPSGLTAARGTTATPLVVALACTLSAGAQAGGGDFEVMREVPARVAYRQAEPGPTILRAQLAPDDEVIASLRSSPDSGASVRELAESELGVRPSVIVTPLLVRPDEAGFSGQAATRVGAVLANSYGQILQPALGRSAALSTGSAVRQATGALAGTMGNALRAVGR